MKELKALFKRCLGAKYTQTTESGDYAISVEGDTLYILFQWSNGKQDWRNNFKFLAIPWKPYKHMKRPWLCHRGFLKVWKAIEPHLQEAIRDQAIKKIEIVGYSHGAALALLCYEYVKYNRPEVSVRGVGFGCPRVFWGVIPKTVKERFKDFRVVRNGHDIVTHVPPAFLGYRHTGTICQIKKVGDGLRPVNDHRPEEYAAVLSRLQQ